MNRIYAISRVTLAAILVYHGLVPKILFRSAQEIQMNEVLMPFLSESQAIYISGISEVVYGFALLVFYRRAYLVIPFMAFAAIATATLLFTHTAFFGLAFNPFTLNLSVIALGAINLLAKPTAERAKEA